MAFRVGLPAVVSYLYGLIEAGGVPRTTSKCKAQPWQNSSSFSSQPHGMVMDFVVCRASGSSSNRQTGSLRAKLDRPTARSGIPAEHHVSCRSIMSLTFLWKGRDLESGFGRATHCGGHLRGRVEDLSGPPPACTAAWSPVMVEEVTVAISQSTIAPLLGSLCFFVQPISNHMLMQRTNVVSLSG